MGYKMSNLSKEQMNHILETGKKHITHITLNITKTDGVYTCGDVYAQREGHDLPDHVIWPVKSAELYIAAAKLRKCAIKATFKLTHYIVDGDAVCLMDDLEITNIPEPPKAPDEPTFQVVKEDYMK